MNPAPSPTPHDRPTRAKIIATLGPATDSESALRRLVEAGASIFRLNFSHGDLDEHSTRLAQVRRLADELGRPLAVMGDLCGPKIRVGVLAEGGVKLETGQDALLAPGADDGPTTAPAGGARDPVLPVTYGGLVSEVAPGHRVLIADGRIRMLAVGRDRSHLRCRVLVGGTVTSGKGVNLPDSSIGVPAITPRDWQCVEWGIRHEIDFLAMSFVRRAAEVRQLRSHLASLGPEAGAIPIIAKIEKPQAVAHLTEIVDAADAVMIARGDLGVEMDLAQVPVVQKRVLAACAEWGKPCLIATQMLESMMEREVPTRAEASDVANAVFDGADGLLLTGETSVGKHPALAVDTMRRIVAVAEAHLAQQPPVASPPARLVAARYGTAALAHGAWHIARDVGAVLVVCWSQSGGTARYLSQNNFRIPIIAYSSDPRATRRMALCGGVVPLRADPPPSGRLADWTDMVERDLIGRAWARKGETVLLLAGKSLGTAKSTNGLAIFRLGDPHGGYRSHGA